MPLKIKYKFDLDENKEQALLGDNYNILVTLEPEDITISEMSL
jgi:hypothetical protein